MIGSQPKLFSPTVNKSAGGGNTRDMRVQTLVCTILLAVSGCTEDRAERMEKTPVTRYDGGFEFNAVFSDLPVEVQRDWRAIRASEVDPAMPIYMDDESFSVDGQNIWLFSYLPAHREKVEKRRRNSSSGDLDNR